MPNPDFLLVFHQLKLGPLGRKGSGSHQNRAPAPQQKRAAPAPNKTGISGSATKQGCSCSQQNRDFQLHNKTGLLQLPTKQGFPAPYTKGLLRLPIKKVCSSSQLKFWQQCATLQLCNSFFVLFRFARARNQEFPLIRIQIMAHRPFMTDHESPAPEC